MLTNKDKYLIILAGPTAVGKTSAAIALAQSYDADIFSCDSRQIYREMSIGTAKPTVSEMQDIKHHFIDSHTIHQTYTAGMYEREIDQAFAKYFDTHKVGILTGGTGLFITAALKGLDDFPQVPSKITEELEKEYEQQGLAGLIQQLEKLDPNIVESIDRENSRRVIRALSVCLAEGKPYSSYLRKKSKELPFTPIYLCLTREREELYNRINMRVDQMVDAGLIEEARSLYPSKDLKALQTVGYQELFDHFDGNCSLPEAIELIKRNSRRYAKRQMTWFRNQGDYKMVNSLIEINDHLTKKLSKSH